jgi:type II secretory pathway pseudopilin PulG
VELIVVIVILGILAAIAVPTLTGYIEKAKWEGYKQEARHIATAAQSIISEYWGGNVTVDGTATRHYNPSGVEMYYVDTSYKYPLPTDFHTAVFTQGGGSWDVPNNTYTPPSQASGWKEFAELTAGSDSAEGAYVLFIPRVDNNGVMGSWDYRVASSWDASISTFRYMVTYDLNCATWRYEPGAGIQVWYRNDDASYTLLGRTHTSGTAGTGCCSTQLEASPKTCVFSRSFGDSAMRELGYLPLLSHGRASPDKLQTIFVILMKSTVFAEKRHLA